MLSEFLHVSETTVLIYYIPSFLAWKLCTFGQLIILLDLLNGFSAIGTVVDTTSGGTSAAGTGFSSLGVTTVVLGAASVLWCCFLVFMNWYMKWLHVLIKGFACTGCPVLNLKPLDPKMQHYLIHFLLIESWQLVFFLLLLLWQSCLSSNCVCYVSVSSLKFIIN